MSEENESVDLLTLALNDAPEPHTFVFKGATYEVRVPSLERQQAIKRQSNEPIMEGTKPLKVNGVPQFERNEARFTALMLIASVFHPGGEKPVFTKAHLSSLMAKSPVHGSFVQVAQDAVLEAMQGPKDASLAEEEEGN